jgi:hypothetical protein
MTALDLARGIAATVNVSSLRRRLFAGRVPSREEMDAGTCPRCGRALPAAVGSQGLMSRGSVALTDAELIQLCLVDGRRSRHTQAITSDDLFAAAAFVAGDLISKGWKKWGLLLDTALLVQGTEYRAEAVGQSLEMFRRYATVESARSTAVNAAPPTPLEILIVSSAVLWPTRDSRAGETQ